MSHHSVLSLQFSSLIGFFLCVCECADSISRYCFNQESLAVSSSCTHVQLLGVVCHVKPERPPCNICIKPCCSFIVCTHAHTLSESLVVVNVAVCFDHTCPDVPFFHQLAAGFVVQMAVCHCYICVFLYSVLPKRQTFMSSDRLAVLSVYTPLSGELTLVCNCCCSYVKCFLFLKAYIHINNNIFPTPPLSPFVVQVCAFQINQSCSLSLCRERVFVV